MATWVPALRSSVARCTASGKRGLHLLHPAPLRNEQRRRLGRFAQRVQVDIFIEAVNGLAAGAKAQARDVVIQSIEPRIRQRGEDEVLDLATIHGAKGLAESGFGGGGIFQLIAFRE